MLDGKWRGAYIVQKTFQVSWLLTTCQGFLASENQLLYLEAHAKGRNIVGQQHSIVGPNILRPFAWNHNVGTCCV